VVPVATFDSEVIPMHAPHVPTIPKGSLVRLRHAPTWHGRITGGDWDNLTALVESGPGSDIPDVGGWPLPVGLLELVPVA